MKYPLYVAVLVSLAGCNGLSPKVATLNSTFVPMVSVRAAHTSPTESTLPETTLPDTSAPAPSAPEPHCTPCSTTYECLDAADAVKAADPKLAKRLAVRDCNREACGYIGRTTLIRCQEYGLPKADPLDCLNDCIEECRGELDPNDEQPWNTCMGACQEEGGCPDSD